MFYGEFSNESDVLREFGVQDFEGVILFAAYETGDYDGSADVIFVQNGLLYLVNGSHCSCHGLEECWDPVEMPVVGFRKIIHEGYGPMKTYCDEIEAILGSFEQLSLDASSPEHVQVALKLIYG